MPEIAFVCLKCQKPFRVPSENLPPEGAKGACSACGTRMLIYPDGRVKPVEDPPAAAPPPPTPTPTTPSPLDNTPWEVMPLFPDSKLTPGVYPLHQLRELILSEKLFEDDKARVAGGDWAPARGYPALTPFFHELSRVQKWALGDEDHCANHRDIKPVCRCYGCRKYLCEDCVENKPTIQGGKTRLLCKECEFETSSVVYKKPISKLFKKLLKK